MTTPARTSTGFLRKVQSPMLSLRKLQTRDAAAPARGSDGPSTSGGPSSSNPVPSEAQLAQPESVDDCDEIDMPLRPGEVPCRRQPVSSSEAQPEPEEFSWGFTWTGYGLLFIVLIGAFCWYRKFGCGCCYRYCCFCCTGRGRQR
ncbi:unnamed protein product [Amoebophrya sp. A25]|nr:unnamed protein product [Amoebophrya sp. A25]|eukprot:GSA25T00017261001.1